MENERRCSRKEIEGKKVSNLAADPTFVISVDLPGIEDQCGSRGERGKFRGIGKPGIASHCELLIGLQLFPRNEQQSLYLQGNRIGASVSFVR